MNGLDSVTGHLLGASSQYLKLSSISDDFSKMTIKVAKSEAIYNAPGEFDLIATKIIDTTDFATALQTATSSGTRKVWEDIIYQAYQFILTLTAYTTYSYVAS